MRLEQTMMLRVLVLCLCFMLQACGSFLDVDPPTSKIPADQMFADDGSALSAIAGVYNDLYSPYSFASGDAGIVTMAGLSSDELHTNSGLPAYQEFEANNISATNQYILSIWTSMYKSIYDVNALIEGLEASSSISVETKTQLRGEALIVRAFCYFYLVNCFGDVPLSLTTDYRVNSQLARTPANDVYKQVEKDLLEAESLLADAYPSSYRARPNRSTATALLARYYLYTKDYQRAEDKASNVISRVSTYQLMSNLDGVFLDTSTEAIWQLKPPDAFSYTYEGVAFGTTYGPKTNVLRDGFKDSFEANDKRAVSWITSVGSSSGTTYLPFKYKLQYSDGNESKEYSVVLRLAEQYLIRSEARAMQEKLTGAVADIDAVRGRAGLMLLKNTNPAITSSELILAIEQERRHEFFTEWGHRWFDLGRRGRASALLTPIKPGWSDSDRLYPLPDQELRNNPQLKPQNNGY